MTFAPPALTPTGNRRRGYSFLRSFRGGRRFYFSENNLLTPFHIECMRVCMNDDAPNKQHPIPETLRKQLSEAGKIGIKKMTPEARARGGKAGWKARIAKALAAEKAAAMGNQQ